MRLIRPTRALLFAIILFAMSSAAFAQFRINITFGPPALPVYEQPLCPGDGYMWTPGYWAWGDDGYYWVPGTWVMAPEVGYLWTPPWWGWDGGYYVFHAGYWGPHIGFYGGINYGFGYTGDGFWGGRWDHDHFFYNREVTNINVTNIRNVYNERVVINNNTRVSFNGGRGGLEVRPTAEQEAAARDHHIEAVSAQREHEQSARGNPELRASSNHGMPSIAATDRPGNFHGGAVAAREAGGPYEAHAPNAVHPKDLPAAEHMQAPNTGSPKLDKKYQQQQDKLFAQQDKERQKLQVQQDKEHVQLQKQTASAERQQQLEQKHQQQTQELTQRHSQQREQLQARQAPPSRAQGKR